MDKDKKIIIEGRKALKGRVKISGAKNAALPELAAAVLSSEELTFRNVPSVADVKVLFKALQAMGAEGTFADSVIRVHLPRIDSSLVPKHIVDTSRASILLLGPLLARHGHARVSMPGGCQIGDRRINYHIDGLRKMGGDIRVEDDHIIGQTNRLSGIEYTFPGKTVTGTENLLMAACLAEGTTILKNCALEPEVGDLVCLLKKMGAEIQTEDQNTLIISGKTSLGRTDHMVIPDRIEMGTFIIAGALEQNNIIVENGVPEFVECLIQILRSIGVVIEISPHVIEIWGNGRLKPAEVATEPFPGFPTDLQAQLTTLLTQAEGVSHIKENIFNNRFQHTGELNKLGADIRVEGNIASIHGKTPLKGKVIRATDLRASAALVLGGLIAEGRTVVENANQLFRGYERMPEKLQSLGASVRILEEVSE